MFELVVFGVPALVASLVFGLSLAISPKEVQLMDVAAPKQIEERGYTPLAISLALQTEIDKIVERSGALNEASKVRVGAHRTGLEELAHVLGVEEAVKATQRVLGMSGNLVEVMVNSGEHGQLVATVTVRNAKTLDLIAERRLHAKENTPEALIETIARYVLEATQPYVYAANLYRQAARGDTSWEETIAWIDRALLDGANERRAELHDLRGLIALERGDHAGAIRSFRQALATDPTLGRSYANWGRTWLDLDRPDRAIEYFTLAERTGDADPPALALHHARALLATGRPREALNRLGRLERTSPGTTHDTRPMAGHAKAPERPREHPSGAAKIGRGHVPAKPAWIPEH